MALRRSYGLRDFSAACLTTAVKPITFPFEVAWSLGCAAMAKTKDATLQLWNAMANVRTAIDRLEVVLVTVVEDVAFAQAARTLMTQRGADSRIPRATTEVGPKRSPRQPAVKTPPAKQVRAKRSTGRKAGEDAEAILAVLSSNVGGLSVGQISDGTRLSPSVVAYRLRVLRSKQRVRMQGTRSKARYFLAEQ